MRFGLGRGQRCSAFFVCLGLVGAATLAAARTAYANPEPVNGSLVDGCQRNPVGLLSYTSPEWVFVNSHVASDRVQVVEGTDTLAHTAEEDLPESHASYDMDSDVIPAPRFQGLLAGTPQPGGGNGNFAPGADQGKLHVEWESGSTPSFVWPTEGDHVKFWGQWVWDCGHWGEGIETGVSNPQASLIGTGDYFLPGQIEGPPPSTLRGEQTELHPLQAMVVIRKASYRAKRRQTEADVFASSDGTHAYAEEQCAQRLSPLPGVASYGPDFAACVNNPANQHQDVTGHIYRFFVPAPRRPSPSARLRWRAVRMVAGHGASAHVKRTRRGIAVRIAFNRVPQGFAGPLAYGASYFVGWSGANGHRPVHLRMTFKSIKVNNALAEPNSQNPANAGLPVIGKYNLYLNVNGYWNFIGGEGIGDPSLNSWVPGLGAVTDGQSFAINRTIDVFVPRGRPVRVDVSGRECDLPRIAPCAATTEVASSNDHPGEAIAVFRSARAALGDHTLVSPVENNYELTYSIRRVRRRPGQPSRPGSTGIAASSAGGNLNGAGTVLP